jgi:hypothetical protein
VILLGNEPKSKYSASVKKKESIHTKKEAETGKLDKRKISLSKKLERNGLTNSFRT